ncbi:MAG TPA: dTDP-4-dehydrorhamnose 3,5-epimerase [Pseudonocardiaceae bacterium]|jgi:dTDP-4-dehydrorhamnose 3,5-epimerase|nr:dTDP-4-dehydrorhamnose 3,5-epimerase [Pseudonocardiaceae bacterium]
MQVRALAIADAFEFTPNTFPDDRGIFTAPYQEPVFSKTVGHPLTVAQTNHSVSRRGTIRGLHFADVPPGQAKYIYTPRGRGLDVIVDLRVGSPTFGQYDTVTLDAASCTAVYLAEGLGHAFQSLEDDTVLSYLCSTSYNPSGEHGVNPFDADLALPWPTDIEPVLSDKDATAPSLAELLSTDALPSYAACLAHYQQLRQL